MKKIIIAVLFAALLLMGGASTLLADTTQDSSEIYEITESPSDSPPTPCGGDGIGNGGGNPG